MIPKPGKADDTNTRFRPIHTLVRHVWLCYLLERVSACKRALYSGVIMKF